jgi:NTE family protein
MPSPAVIARAFLLLALLVAPGCGSLRAPAEGPAGAAPRVGLALGGGGARGFAEIGVLRVLEQERVPIEIVVGTSVGALVGALYADSGRVLDAEFHAVAIQAEHVFDYGALSVFSGGLIRGDRLEAFVRERLRNQNIQDMALRFAAVAVDLESGKTVTFTRGSAARAVRASAAIPGIFVPVTINGRPYVDGAVVDPVPVRAARQLGAEFVIGVSIPPEIRPVAPKSMVEIIHRSVSIMSNEISEARAREADVVIRPAVGDIAFDDFSRKKELIEAGEVAARAAMPAIRAALGLAPAAPATAAR